MTRDLTDGTTIAVQPVAGGDEWEVRLAIERKSTLRWLAFNLTADEVRALIGDLHDALDEVLAHNEKEER